MSLEEYLAQAPTRDEAYRQATALAEAKEDQYFDELSRAIDEHPIGRPMSKIS